MKAFFTNLISQCKNKLISVISNTAKHLQNNPRQTQFGLIIAGEALGYLCGVPLPLLTVFPFIVAPTLLKPVIDHAYLTIPFGIMAYQINKDPAQHLTRHLLNLGVIAGLLFGKKMISKKIAANQSLEVNWVPAPGRQEQTLVMNAQPKTVLFNHTQRTNQRKTIPHVPLSYLMNNLSDDDSSEDSDYEPYNYKNNY